SPAPTAREVFSWSRLLYPIPGGRSQRTLVRHAGGWGSVCIWWAGRFPRAPSHLNLAVRVLPTLDSSGGPNSRPSFIPFPREVQPPACVCPSSRMTKGTIRPSSVSFVEEVEQFPVAGETHGTKKSWTTETTQRLGGAGRGGLPIGYSDHGRGERTGPCTPFP